MKFQLRLIVAFLCAALLLSGAAFAAEGTENAEVMEEVWELFPNLSPGTALEGAALLEDAEDPSSYDAVKQTILEHLIQSPEEAMELTFEGSKEELLNWIDNTVYPALCNTVYNHPEELYYVKTGYKGGKYWPENGKQPEEGGSAVWHALLTPMLYDELRTDEAAEAYQRALDLACIEAFGSLTPADNGMTDLEKVTAAHDWLVTNCRYDPVVGNAGENASSWTSPSGRKYKADELVYSPYGALVNGNAVCQGYGLAFSAMMHRAGIPCVCVTTDDHMWNQVQLGSPWYNIDCTKDDPIYKNDRIYDFAGHVYRKYFLKSDIAFVRLQKTGSWTSEERHICVDYPLPSALTNAAEVAVYPLDGSLLLMRSTGDLEVYSWGRNFLLPTEKTELEVVPDSAALDYESGSLYLGTASEVYRVRRNGTEWEKEEYPEFSEAKQGNGLELERLEDGSISLNYIFAYEVTDGYPAGEQARRTLTLQRNDGEADTTRSAYYGDLMELPEPVREDAEFLGWYLDSALTQPAGAAVRIPYWDVTLYAGWEEETQEPALDCSLDSAGGMLRYAAALPEGTEAQVVIATYDSTGRLLDTTWPTTASGYAAAGAENRYRVFLVDKETFQPLCPAWDSAA